MKPYSNTNTRIFLQSQLAVLLVRGVYGVLVALTLYLIFSLNENALSLLILLVGDYHLYFTWIYLAILYPISIVIIKVLLNLNKKFDLYLRGISIYFASAIITYSILSAT